ncbi:MAG TPA: TIM-barrel domain-containing protein, partial [Nitrospirota bacterium]
HHPLERQGVDFFWLDWQQQPTTAIPGVNPTWWLNYVHFTDMEREGKRPLIFHRWGGLGNHRYQIGFSGDTVSVWDSLAFQPYFTATAANVGYGYWSHDIGGHMPGKVSPELYTRWIQFGVFSPILRTHTTKNPESERRIWAYPAGDAKTMRDAFLLRYALIPYIYTAARNAYDTGVSILQPMYYDYPETKEAYAFKDQYMFGDSMLVAPIATPVSPESLLATKTVWLPPGTWFEWFSGTQLEGPARIERTFSMEEIPVYVKAGAIIPMQPKMKNTRERPVDPLILNVFPGGEGSTRIYEDAGDTLGYKNGEYAWTKVRNSRLENGTMKIEIYPAQGRYPGMLSERAYEIRIAGTWPPDSVVLNQAPVSFSREEKSPGWRYEGDRLTTIISIPRTRITEPVELLITFPKQALRRPLTDGFPGKLARLNKAMTLLDSLWPDDWPPDSLVELVQTGSRITLDPKNAVQELEKLDYNLPRVIREVANLKGDPSIKNRALSHLKNLALR